MLNFDDVQDAARRIEGVVHRTPVLTSRSLDDLLGMQVFLKAENLQRTGAYKFRGAYNAINALTEAERARGVVAFSAGNHGQALALAARLHGCRATVVMPRNASVLKVTATRAYGAEVLLLDRYRDERDATVRRLVEEQGAHMIHPFDYLPVMAGQGTAAVELLQDTAALDALIAPVGGGGLLSGCTVAAKQMRPAIRVFGAEPMRANDLQQSLRADRTVSIDAPRTICDGQQSQAVGAHPFEVIRSNVTDVLTAPDPTVVEAMRFVFERMKLVLEPSGACALAALMQHREAFRGQRVGVVLSGGNVGLERLVALITGTERVD